jgi:hypothetical protein
VLKVKAKVCFFNVKRIETDLKGDPSEEFSFSNFFPEYLR